MINHKYNLDLDIYYYIVSKKQNVHTWGPSCHESWAKRVFTPETKSIGCTPIYGAHSTPSLLCFIL